MDGVDTHELEGETSYEGKHVEKEDYTYVMTH